MLNPSDRAALQGLIPLAGALGAGTIFALFFGGRRKAGFAVFEVFVVIAVLTAVASTAYFCIALLHRDQAITDHDLTQTATPLIVAVFFLSLVSIGARIPGKLERAVPIIVIAVLGGALAAWLASSTWSATPENASIVAVLILGVGMLLGLVAWTADTAHLRSARKGERRRVERLCKLGYAPAHGTLGLALPLRKGEGRPQLGYWTRGGQVFLDLDALLNLRAEADKRWYALSDGDASLPDGHPVLLRVEINSLFSWLLSKPSVRLATTSPGGGEHVRELERNDNGLFDVS